ncbi:MAG TPA: Asp-tRNA(Asn)/Glu-tRNA(Gln) amidotransferase subunit GatA [Polyangiales bacterium]
MIELNAGDIAARVRRGELSASDVLEQFLARCDAHNPGLNAIVLRADSQARAQARAVDEKRARGETLGPLAGVPIAVKDNLCTRGLATTCASRILRGYQPPYDAHVIERVLAADAVIVGKANMDEFAMGSSNENSAHGPARNPWDVTRVPGGSSGGSAVACAARLAPLALGSDTGGSVRQPAAFCGISAIKPSYGRVSRYGLVAYASSLDQVGPLARTTRDAALLLSVIAGHDPRDATSARRPAEAFDQAAGQPVTGLRVGVVRDLDPAGNSAEVNRAFERALAQLVALGAQLVDVRLPTLKYAIAAYYLVATAEASSNLARFDGMRFGVRVTGSDLTSTYGATRTAGFGAEVKRRIMLGTYALSAGYYEAYYLKAQKVRTLIARDYARAFESCDVIATPTTPTAAFKLGEKVEDPLAMYLNDLYTLPPNLAGIPALSTPMGFDDAGLPLGLQLTAPQFEEQRLIALGDAFERATDYTQRTPAGF